MKFIFQVILTALVSYMVELWLGPWAIAVCAAIISFSIRTNGATSFLGGFVALSLLWMSKATFIDVATHSVISSKIIPLLGFQHPIMLILLTGLIGGILGGFGSLIGQQLYRLLQKNQGDVYRK